MIVGLSVATMYYTVHNFVWLLWQPFKSHTLISWGLCVTITRRNIELLVHNHVQQQGRTYYRVTHVIYQVSLTHWGRLTHICVSKLTIISSDNGLSPSRRQAIIWTNAGILLIGPLGANFSEILIASYTFWFKKMQFKMSSEKWRPFCLGLCYLSLISSHR